MKKSLKLIAGIIMLSAVLVSCGQKKSIWNDLSKENGLSDKIMTNVTNGVYDLNEMSEEGFSVLTQYGSELDRPTLEKLVKAGADINLKDANDNYPLLSILKESDNLSAISYVIETVTDVNVKNKDESTAINCMLQNHALLHETSVLFSLLQKGLDYTEFDYEKNYWPFLKYYENNNNNEDLLQFIMSNNMQFCRVEDWYSNISKKEIIDSFILAKDKKHLDSEDFNPSFNTEEYDIENGIGDNKFLFNLLPADDYDAEKTKTISHYLMCDTKIGDKSFKAGTLVDIISYAESEVVKVDDVLCRNYNVKIDGKDYVLSGRYISMYSSTRDIDGDGIIENLLSTFYSTGLKSDFDYYCFCSTADKDNIYLQDVVIIKDKKSYKIDIAEAASIPCAEFMKFMDGSQPLNCPVISAEGFSSPVDSIYAFYCLYGNKLKKICIKNIYDTSEFPLGYFTRFELAKTVYGFDLIFAMDRCINEEDLMGESEVRQYIQRYTLKYPFTWCENGLEMDER